MPRSRASPPTAPAFRWSIAGRSPGFRSARWATNAASPGRPLAPAGRSARGLLLRKLGLPLAAVDRRPGICLVPGRRQRDGVGPRLLFPRSGARRLYLRQTDGSPPRSAAVPSPHIPQTEAVRRDLIYTLTVVRPGRLSIPYQPLSKTELEIIGPLAPARRSKSGIGTPTASRSSGSRSPRRCSRSAGRGCA